MSLAQKEKYDEAIYKLSLVPIACTSCYSKCSFKIHEVYEASINQDGKRKLSEANAIWASSSNLEGAERAIGLLSKIHLDASSKKDADKLIEQISSKLQADEKRDWELKLKQYEDAQKMEQQRMKMVEESDIRNSQLESERLNAARQVALEYAKNLPKTVTYNNIYWK
jgi:GTPase SAR1 family protein